MTTILEQTYGRDFLIDFTSKNSNYFIKNKLIS